MINPKLHLLNNVYASGEGLKIHDRVVHLVGKNIKNRKSLFVGYVHPYIESFQNCDTCYAVPMEYKDCVIPLSNKNILLDGYKLPLVDGTFDLVVVMHLFEFSSYSTEFLQEFYRILAGGGMLINISFNKCTQHNIRCTSTNKIIELLTDNEKFSIDKICGINNGLSVWPYNFHLNVSKYTEFLLKIMPFLSDVICIKAIKTELESVPLFTLNYGMANG